MSRPLPQRCAIVFVYLQWLIVAVAVVVLAVERLWLGVIVGLVAAPAAIYGYVRVFPRISRAMGYGSVADVAADPTTWAPGRVVLYTGVGCPFCPIMEKRLRALQSSMGFELEVIDVTARPDLVGRKRIGSVPMLEVDGRRHSGCMTSQQLATFIREPVDVPARGLEPVSGLVATRE